MFVWLETQEMRWEQWSCIILELAGLEYVLILNMLTFGCRTTVQLVLCVPNWAIVKEGQE